MTDLVPIPILNVEERLRVCLTLTKGLYQLSELASEHHYVRLEGFEPDDFLHRVPDLTRALRDQLLSVHAALSYECMTRKAPKRVPQPRLEAALASSPAPGELAASGEHQPHVNVPIPKRAAAVVGRHRKGGAR